MIVRGINFTSAPGRHTPITSACCELTGNTLTISKIERLTEFAEFEAYLNQPGPWLCGLNFPFGQPGKLIERMGWPPSWPLYVAQIRRMGQQNFVKTLNDYKAPRAEGDKDHLRDTDALTGAASPMSTTNPPAGKMFFEGAPRLLASLCNIPGLRPTDDNRTVLETYPHLAANHLIGREPYTGPGPQARGARAMLVGEITSKDADNHFGIHVSLPNGLINEMARENNANELDAVLCALLTAWSIRHENYGIPKNTNPLEGWMIGPALGEPS